MPKTKLWLRFAIIIIICDQLHLIRVSWMSMGRGLFHWVGTKYHRHITVGHPYPPPCHLWLSITPLGGVRSYEPPVHSRMLAGLVFCRSCGGSHCCCEFCVQQPQHIQQTTFVSSHSHPQNLILSLPFFGTRTFGGRDVSFKEVTPQSLAVSILTSYASVSTVNRSLLH